MLEASSSAKICRPFGVVTSDAARETLGERHELLDLVVDEVPLEDRDERGVDDRERRRDDDEEREAEPRADAAERAHGTLKR